ncbi:MAG: hypothetical protein KBA46_01940 [Candidatus Omnitrophica bacterium]|nr:hypothetical protein [Candidatus Omnitrophota bacterium]
MIEEARQLEKEAYALLTQEKYGEACRLFKKAAESFCAGHNHKEAALCFASAASCWAIKSGEKTFQLAAQTYELAAKEAHKAGDLDYASLLYKYAASNYERDLEFINFSDCVYQSRECKRQFFWLSLLQPRKIHSIAHHRLESGPASIMRHAWGWFALSISHAVWGHGERPFRALGFALGVILTSAFLYSWGSAVSYGLVVKPDLFEALYMSVITFSTVGYGDVTPHGVIKIVAMVEALSGMVLIPVFITGLSRKYLRI